MLGNLLTSLISGIGTYVWLLVFGIPYALLLALVVALFDLIPMVGSTIAGIIVSRRVVEGHPDRYCHARLLHCVSLLGGLPPQPKGDEADRESYARPYDHRDVDWRNATWTDRRPSRHSSRSNDSPAAR